MAAIVSFIALWVALGALYVDARHDVVKFDDNLQIVLAVVTWPIALLHHLFKIIIKAAQRR